MEKIARRHHYKLQIHRLPSFKDNVFRAALFSEDIRCMVFPPLVHFPGIGELASKDLRGYVSAGNNLVFVGSYEWLSVMNDVFGFQLQSSYADGPYYRNDRTVKGTPFQWSRSMLSEPDAAVYGVKTDSVPMDGNCMFDTMGTCVVFYVKYNLGTVRSRLPPPAAPPRCCPASLLPRLTAAPPRCCCGTLRLGGAPVE